MTDTGDLHAHLYSPATVSVSTESLRRMAEVVAAVERVVALPAYREHVFAYAPASARVPSSAKGAFLGYDFHETPEGPKLIEINTNAGGGLLCARHFGREDVAGAFVEMFRAEFHAGGGDRSLRAVAIVDDDPASQYLYPEFEAFKALFESRGIAAVVCDPRDLMHCHGGIWHEETKIDLVYNRLTDFALDDPAHVALRLAWTEGAAVVTPHPRAYALYAHKRNLVALSDDGLLAGWGVDEATRAVLAAGIPRTERVTPERADDFWARRRQLFFKPATGFGSRAAYQGDRITKRVFGEVMAGDYVAQELAPPAHVNVAMDGEMTELKADLRNYVYDGRVQLVAARLWRGQTTNFRTPGGGFARVIEA